MKREYSEENTPPVPEKRGLHGNELPNVPMLGEHLQSKENACEQRAGFGLTSS